MTTATDDPIRTEVERVLRAVVGVTVVAPFAVATAVPRCMVRHLSGVCQRLGEPARIVLSVFDLVGAGAGRPVIAPDVPGAPNEPAAPLRLVPDDAAATPSDEHLPIDEYESRAASQVVARLPTLTEAELEEVR